MGHRLLHMLGFGPAVALAFTSGAPHGAAAQGAAPEMISRVVELPSPYGSMTKAYGINADGVVVGETYVYGEPYAFRWSERYGFVRLTRGAGLAINRDGVIAGRGGMGGIVPPGTVWTDDQPQVISLGDATDVAENGWVVGWHYWPSTVWSAFLWEGSGAARRDLGTLRGFGYFAGFSQAMAVTERREVLGWSDSNAGIPHAFRWTASEGMVDLGAPAGQLSVAMDGDRHGLVVGGAGPHFDSTRAVVWSKHDGIVALADLGGGRGLALAVNDFGQIAGWSETSDGVRHAVVWRRSGAVIDLGPGEAHDINGAGEVAGWRPVAGGTRGMVWYLTPAARGGSQ